MGWDGVGCNWMSEGFGSIFVGTDTETGEEVGIKVVRLWDSCLNWG